MSKLKICTVLVIFCLLPAAAALASSSGSAGSSLAAWKDFGWRVLNFVLFAGIIYKLAGKKTKEFFSGRKESIRSEIEDLENRKANVQNKLKEVEDSIADMETRKQEILEQAREQGEAAKNSIIAKAEQEAEKIRKQAETKAEQERQQILERLREEMAEKIVDSAEKIIVSKMGKKQQEKLIDEYLTKVVVN